MRKIKGKKMMLKNDEEKKERKIIRIRITFEKKFCKKIKTNVFKVLKVDC